jgi:uncharacterized GH25 family protein
VKSKNADLGKPTKANKESEMKVFEPREQLNTKGIEIAKLTKEKKDREMRVFEPTAQLKTNTRMMMGS